MRLHSETLAHLLERFFLLLKLSSRFVHFRLKKLHISVQRHVLLLQLFELACHVLEHAAFDVKLRLEIGDRALVVCFHGLLFFFELLLDATDLKFCIGSSLCRRILIA